MNYYERHLGDYARDTAHLSMMEHGAYGLLLAARRHHLTPHLLDLRNSGDTAGDRSRVVGYASIAFSDDNNHAHH